MQNYDPSQDKPFSAFLIAQNRVYNETEQLVKDAMSGKQDAQDILMHAGQRILPLGKETNYLEQLHTEPAVINNILLMHLLKPLALSTKTDLNWSWGPNAVAREKIAGTIAALDEVEGYTTAITEQLLPALNRPDRINAMMQAIEKIKQVFHPEYQPDTAEMEAKIEEIYSKGLVAYLQRENFLANDPLFEDRALYTNMENWQNALLSNITSLLEYNLPPNWFSDLAVRQGDREAVETMLTTTNNTDDKQKEIVDKIIEAMQTFAQKMQAYNTACANNSEGFSTRVQDSLLQNRFATYQTALSAIPPLEDELHPLLYLYLLKKSMKQEPQDFLAMHYGLSTRPQFFYCFDIYASSRPLIDALTYTNAGDEYKLYFALGDHLHEVPESYLVELIRTGSEIALMQMAERCHTNDPMRSLTYYFHLYLTSRANHINASEQLLEKIHRIIQTYPSEPLVRFYETFLNLLHIIANVHPTPNDLASYASICAFLDKENLQESLLPVRGADFDAESAIEGMGFLYLSTYKKIFLANLEKLNQHIRINPDFFIAIENRYPQIKNAGCLLQQETRDIVDARERDIQSTQALRRNPLTTFAYNTLPEAEDEQLSLEATSGLT